MTNLVETFVCVCVSASSITPQQNRNLVISSAEDYLYEYNWVI